MTPETKPNYIKGQLKSNVSNGVFKLKSNRPLSHREMKDLSPGKHHFPYLNRRQRRAK